MYNTLEQIMTRVENLKQLVDTDLSKVANPSTISGFKAKVSVAKEEIEALKKKILPQVLPVANVTFYTGPEDLRESTRKKLKESGAIVVEADHYYAEIAKRVHEYMGRYRTFSVDKFGQLLDLFREISSTIGIDIRRTLNLPTTVINKELPNLQDVRAVVNEVFEKNLGQEVLTKTINNSILNQIYERSLKTLPKVYVFGVRAEHINLVAKTCGLQNFSSIESLDSDRKVEGDVDAGKKKKKFDKKLGE